MMDDSPVPRQPAFFAGLCDSCRHGRIVCSDRGTRFLRCGLADLDRNFPRYPVLPVLFCPGYTRDGRA